MKFLFQTVILSIAIGVTVFLGHFYYEMIKTDSIGVCEEDRISSLCERDSIEFLGLYGPISRDPICSCEMRGRQILFSIERE